MTAELACRPLREDDRWRLLGWRNSDRIRAMSTDDVPIDPEVHSRWFDRVLAERFDELRMVEWRARPVGVVQIEALDRAQSTAAWGCYLGDTEVPPGVGAILPLIALGHGFGSLALRRMTAQVLSVNSNMVSVHRRLRIPVEGVLRRHARRADGHELDVHLYGVHRDEWREVRDDALLLLPSHLRDDVSALTT
jgi:RimJ/RimL family protein N-acetyltransferase